MNKENIYSWNIQIKWITEFVRKDAEILVVLDYCGPNEERLQKVISSANPTIEDAKLVAFQYSEDLYLEVAAFIRNKLKDLKTAKE